MEFCDKTNTIKLQKLSSLANEYFKVLNLTEANNTSNFEEFKSSHINESTINSLDFKLMVKKKLESPILIGQKLLLSGNSSKNWTPTSISTLNEYSERISGSTIAPPETSNITDPVLHHSIYPNYHFLNYVSHEEMLRSRLWDIIFWDNVCFPPRVKSNRSENPLRIQLILTCSTPEASIFFKLGNGSFIRYESTKNYFLNTDKILTVQAYSSKPGYKESKTITQEI